MCSSDLEGHTEAVRSITYHPDGRHIISGSSDRTIRIWDAATGAAVGKPLAGHTAGVWSVAYSPDGQQIISGSLDRTIRIWDAKTGALLGAPLRGHSDNIWSIACSPSGKHIVSGSDDNTIRVWNAFAHLSVQPASSCSPMHTQFCAQPDPDGWVRDLKGGLLYWVPPDCRTSLHAPSLFTISLTPDIQSVSLDFEDFTFGTSWTQILNSA